jgi:transposase
MSEQRVKVVGSIVWMFLDKRGITFKKRRRMPASSNAPMSCASAGTGSTGSRTSTPTN